MVDSKLIKPTLGERRWKYFHGTYVCIYSILMLKIIYYEWVVLGKFYPFVTSILGTSVFLLVTGLAIPNLKNITLKYIFLPAFGLMWTVFSIRLSFEIFAGPQWLSIFSPEDFAPSYFSRAADFLMHFLTLFVGYQILHVYEEDLEKQYAKTSNALKLFLAYFPCLAIVVWTFFYDPYQTYKVPKNLMTQIGLYVVPPLLLTYTYTIYRTIVKPDDEVRHVLKTFRLSTLGLIATILGLGVYVFGWQNLYTSIISWICYGLMIMMVMRLLFGSKMWFSTVALFPLYGLIIGFYFMREVVFSWLGGNHEPFLALIQPGIANGEMLYTVYMLLTYICLAPVIGEIFIMEVPYRLNRHTLLKRAMLRQRHQLGECAWLHELWNGYGAVLVLILYLFVGEGAQRYFPDQPIWESVLYSVMGMIIVCAIFPHMLYRRYIKRAEGL